MEYWVIFKEKNRKRKTKILKGICKLLEIDKVAAKCGSY